MITQLQENAESSKDTIEKVKSLEKENSEIKAA